MLSWPGCGARQLALPRLRQDARGRGGSPSHSFTVSTHHPNISYGLCHDRSFGTLLLALNPVGCLACVGRSRLTDAPLRLALTFHPAAFHHRSVKNLLAPIMGCTEYCSILLAIVFPPCGVYPPACRRCHFIACMLAV